MRCGMIKLLRAGFRRVFKSIIFWLGLCASFVMGVIAALNTRSCKGLDDAYIMPFFVIVAIVVSLLIGTEHGDGALRNKIATGHSKGNIYFANLTVFLAFSLLASLVYLGVFSLLMIGHTGTFPTYALIVSAVGFVLVALSYTVIMVSVSMMISQRAVNAVICILLVLATVFASYAIDDMLGHSEFIEIVTSVNNGNFETIKEENPRYIGGVKREILQSIEWFIPYGSMTEYMKIINPCFWEYNIVLNLTPEKESHLKILPLYSVLSGFSAGVIGWYFFRKKELK